MASPSCWWRRRCHPKAPPPSNVTGTETELPEPVRRVADFLTASGVEARPQMLAQNTRTAQMAADAIGCELGAIVKSIIFAVSDDLVLVMMSGDRRIDTDR